MTKVVSRHLCRANSNTITASYLVRVGASTKCQSLSLTHPIFSVNEPPLCRCWHPRAEPICFSPTPFAIARVFSASLRLPTLGYTVDSFAPAQLASGQPSVALSLACPGARLSFPLNYALSRGCSSTALRFCLKLLQKLDSRLTLFLQLENGFSLSPKRSGVRDKICISPIAAG